MSEKDKARKISVAKKLLSEIPEADRPRSINYVAWQVGLDSDELKKALEDKKPKKEGKKGK